MLLSSARPCSGYSSPGAPLLEHERLSSSWTLWSRRGGVLRRPECARSGVEPFPVVLGRTSASGNAVPPRVSDSAAMANEPVPGGAEPPAGAPAHDGVSAGSLRRGVVLLAATGVIWGSIGLVVRLLQDRGEPVVPIAFWRFVCASVVLVPVLGPAGLRELARRARRPGRLIVVAVGSLVFQLLYFYAVRDVGVAVATLVALGLAPVALTCTEALVARTAPATRTLVALALALTGLVLVTALGAPSPHTAPRPMLGIIEAIVSGLAYAAATTWSGPLSRRLEPGAITLAASGVGAVLLLPVTAATGWHLPHSAPVIAGILWLAVVATVIAYGLFYAGLRSTPGSVAMILTLLEPVTAVVLAAALLGEPLTPANVLGGILLLGAVVVLYLAPPR
jgi:DME family drug/metabolite transporter